MSGRVVVVTGASGGVGRATARAFGALGDSVALLARGETGLDGAVEDVEKAGGDRAGHPDRHGRLRPGRGGRRAGRARARADRRVGERGLQPRCSRRSRDHPGEFQRTTEVAYLGYVHGTKAALDRMLPRDRGVIVQVGSALAYRGIPLQTRLLRGQARDPGLQRVAARAS